MNRPFTTSQPGVRIGSRHERMTVATSIEPRDDAFSGLAPGAQRIARALYDAQVARGASESSPAGSGCRLRSLDEIAGMEKKGTGWSLVFKQLKAEGLIAEQTLGHVVARWTRFEAGAHTPGRPGAEPRLSVEASREPVGLTRPALEPRSLRLSPMPS